MLGWQKQCVKGWWREGAGWGHRDGGDQRFMSDRIKKMWGSRQMAVCGSRE